MRRSEWCRLSAGLAVVLACGAAVAEVRVGVAVTSAEAALGTQVAAAVRGAAVDPEVVWVEGCDDVTFCVSVVAVAVQLGRRESGYALASHVSRRLLAHPDWPWPAEPAVAAAGASGTLRIEDAFTAGGDLACVPCERALEGVQREVRAARTVARPTLVDEGDLQLQVGPATVGFVREAGASVAQGLIERHIRPWQASRER